MKKRNFIYMCFILPSFIGIMAFYIVPFLLSLYFAVIDNMMNKEWVGLKNFKLLFSANLLSTNAKSVDCSEFWVSHSKLDLTPESEGLNSLKGSLSPEDVFAYFVFSSSLNKKFELIEIFSFSLFLCYKTYSYIFIGKKKKLSA